jgi:hypothetical protein
MADTKDTEDWYLFCPLNFTYIGWPGATVTGYGERNPNGDTLVSELVRKALNSTKWISPSPRYPPRLTGVSVGEEKSSAKPTPVEGSLDVPLKQVCKKGMWLHMDFEIPTTPEKASRGEAGVAANDAGSNALDVKANGAAPAAAAAAAAMGVAVGGKRKDASSDAAESDKTGTKKRKKNTTKKEAEQVNANPVGAAAAAAAAVEPPKEKAKPVDHDFHKITRGFKFARHLNEDGSWTDVTPKSKSFKLEALQKFVGGYIDVVPLSDCVTMIINDVGLDTCSRNEEATRICDAHEKPSPIHGPVLFCSPSLIK